MAIIGNSSVTAISTNPIKYEVAGYPDYLIAVSNVRDCDFYIEKIGEPIPYINVIYSSLYAATKAVQTIEAFKTLMRAKKAAKEAVIAKETSSGS